MTSLGLTLPLKIRTFEESIAIEDSKGVRGFYVYFCEEPGRRSQTGRVTEAQAREIADLVLRTLTEAVRRETRALRSAASSRGA